MSEKLAELKDKLLSTGYPRWKNILSSLFLFLITSGMVVTWWYLYYSTADIECHKGFFYLSVLWLVAQWGTIGFLFIYKNIPLFARNAIMFMILIGNSWFGLFIFSLQSCSL